MQTENKTQATKELFIFNYLEQKKINNKNFSFCNYFVNELKECTTLNECYEVIETNIQHSFFTYFDDIIESKELESLFIEVIKQSKKSFTTYFIYYYYSIDSNELKTKLLTFFKMLSEKDNILFNNDIFNFIENSSLNYTFKEAINFIIECNSDC